MEIIDCHSHVGNDWVWGDSNFNVYIDMCERLGVTSSFIMPSPGPLDFEKKEKKLLLYEMTNDGFKYWSQLDDSYLSSRKINEFTFDIISKYNGNVNIYFVPFIHPILDSTSYIEEIFKKYNPVAYKIHGVATGVTPKLFSKEMIETIRRINIPIIVHTDYSTEKNTIQGLNSSYEWAKFFVENNLKGYLTHAARFDKRTYELVNNNCNLVVGLGPDLLIYDRRPKEYNIEDTNTLEILKENVDINKILFDIDFSWNVSDYNKTLDYGMIERVKEVYKEDAARVLSLNAKRFFKV